MHGAEWQNAKTTGVMANNQALIPLLGITLDSSYSITNAYIYTNHMSVVIQLPTNLFIFLHDYSHLEYIYILYNPDGLYSNSYKDSLCFRITFMS